MFLTLRRCRFLFICVLLLAWAFTAGMHDLVGLQHDHEVSERSTLGAVWSGTPAPAPNPAVFVALTGALEVAPSAQPPVRLGEAPRALPPLQTHQWARGTPRAPPAPG